MAGEKDRNEKRIVVEQTFRHSKSPLRVLAATITYSAKPDTRLAPARASGSLSTEPVPSCGGVRTRKSSVDRQSPLMDGALHSQSDNVGAVYTVRLAGRIYVLHVFQKKSKGGIKTPKAEIELIKSRLKRAEQEHARRSEARKEQA